MIATITVETVGVYPHCATNAKETKPFNPHHHVVGVFSKWQEIGKFSAGQ